MDDMLKDAAKSRKKRKEDKVVKAKQDKVDLKSAGDNDMRKKGCKCKRRPPCICFFKFHNARLVVLNESPMTTVFIATFTILAALFCAW